LKVHAAGINPVDWKLLHYNWINLPFPHGIGSDVSGVIVKLGPNVKDWKVGDEVFTQTSLLSSYGSFAEYTVTEAHRLAHKGSKLSHVQAASLPVAFLSAWDGFTRIPFESKQTIFVAGGAGGVGHFIVQLAKNFGLTVFASGGKEESLKVLKDLGVDHVLNYAKDNVVDEILKATDNKGVDHVFDSTYVASSFENSAKTLKEGGNFIILGNHQSSETLSKTLAEKKAKYVLADLGQFNFNPKVSAEVQRIHIAQGLDNARRYFEEGRLKPITKTTTFDEIVGLFDELHKGKTYNGKVVLEVAK